MQLKQERRKDKRRVSTYEKQDILASTLHTDWISSKKSAGGFEGKKRRGPAEVPLYNTGQQRADGCAARLGGAWDVSTLEARMLHGALRRLYFRFSLSVSFFPSLADSD